MLMLKSLDKRKAPDMDAYEEASGESLKNFLGRFEKYCSKNIAADKHKTFWLPELKKLLTGDLLKADVGIESETTIMSGPLIEVESSPEEREEFL